MLKHFYLKQEPCKRAMYLRMLDTRYKHCVVTFKGKYLLYCRDKDATVSCTNNLSAGIHFILSFCTIQTVKILVFYVHYTPTLYKLKFCLLTPRIALYPFLGNMLLYPFKQQCSI